MENFLITKPTSGEYPAGFDHYVKLVPSEDLLGYFSNQKESIASAVASLPEEKLLYRYAPGKWSIKDIFNHVIDCERIYNYRALSIARGEKLPLPGFEENDYAREALADHRNIQEMVKEFQHVRSSTISLFTSFTEEMLLRKGFANGSPRSVRTLGYLAAGHELHHLNVIKERYLFEA
jgi:uncharacterized damage-inducible protein DinB